MRNAAQARRAIWLRRTRLATSWIAVVATVATLLIAALAASASTAKKVTLPLPAARRRLAFHVQAHAVHVHFRQPTRRESSAPTVRRKPAPVVRPKPVVVAPAPVPSPVVPVVVSGGS
jgi:hypothetical protein